MRKRLRDLWMTGWTTRGARQWQDVCRGPPPEQADLQRAGQLVFSRRPPPARNCAPALAARGEGRPPPVVDFGARWAWLVGVEVIVGGLQADCDIDLEHCLPHRVLLLDESQAHCTNATLGLFECEAEGRILHEGRP